MEYKLFKDKLTGLFNEDKLQKSPGEWGFYNEMEKDVKRVGYATNLTPEIIRKAGREKIDFLLTHHDSWEFVFGLKESCNRILIEEGITHAFFHAPLDDAGFGTSASLAKALGLTGCIKVMPYADLYYGGVIGNREAEDFNVFREQLSHILKEDVRGYQNNDRPVKRVAVAAGGGNMTTDMQIAVKQGCDTYVTGEYVLYSQQYAEFSGMNLLVGSHTNTEILGVEAMAELLGSSTDVRLIRIPEPNY